MFYNWSIERWILTQLKKEVIEMAILTFQNIMEADDITETTLPIPEWGGEVVVRSISYRKMSGLKTQAKAMKDAGMEIDEDFVEKKMFELGMVNPKMSEEEVEHIWDKASTPVMKILTTIMGSSKATEKDQKDAEKSLPSGPE